MAVETPLMIDSTEADVIEAALSLYPGRGLINSINLENGRERVDAVLPIARKHGAAVVALTIDEIGMAKTAARKLEIARNDHRHRRERIRPGARRPDLRHADLHAGDRRSGDGEQRRRNDGRDPADQGGTARRADVARREQRSFGLGPAARAVLNSVFLYHCVEAGLDMAIVNPAHITPYAEIPEDQRKLANELIFNEHPDALTEFIQYFEQHTVSVGGDEAGRSDRGHDRRRGAALADRPPQEGGRRSADR